MRFSALFALVFVGGCSDASFNEVAQAPDHEAEAYSARLVCPTDQPIKIRPDRDGDFWGRGYAICSQVVPAGFVRAVYRGDCNDHDSFVNPGMLEAINNGVDDDCNPATEDLPVYIVGTAVSTVWYVDQDSVRHCFPTPQVFFTWEDSWDVVTPVSDSDAASLVLGDNMSFKPGVVLVKIQSDPNAYAVTENPNSPYRPIIRWIETEALAEEIYGANWSDYIVDVQDVFFTDYIIGESVDEAADLPGVDLSLMKTRAELAAY